MQVIECKQAGQNYDKRNEWWFTIPKLNDQQGISDISIECSDENKSRISAIQLTYCGNTVQSTSGELLGKFWFMSGSNYEGMPESYREYIAKTGVGVDGYLRDYDMLLRYGQTFICIQTIEPVGKPVVKIHVQDLPA
jgi:hypothetical protein